MWLSQKLTNNIKEETTAELGIITMEGEHPAVLSGGEERDLPVIVPGGYAWLPGYGEKVIILRGGTGSEEKYIAGKEQSDPPVALQCGEICLYTAGGSIVLRNDGRIDLNGTVYLNGERLYANRS